MPTKITLFSLILSALHAYKNENYDTTILQSCVSSTSILYHYNLMEEARHYDMIVSQTTVFYYFYKWLYYECYDVDRLAIFLWMCGICLYILGVYLNSNVVHGLMHLTFVYASILLHNIIKDKMEIKKIEDERNEENERNKQKKRELRKEKRENRKKQRENRKIREIHKMKSHENDK